MEELLANIDDDSKEFDRLIFRIIKNNYIANPNSIPSLLGVVYAEFNVFEINYIKISDTQIEIDILNLGLLTLYPNNRQYN